MVYEAALSPFRIGNLELRNRIVRTAHGTGLTGDDLIAYHEARAKGGVSLSILGVAGVHESTRTPDIPVHDDRVIGLYAELARRSHRHDMAVMQQLWHGGSAYQPRPRVPQWSSSEVANPVVGTVPQAMDLEQIQEVVASFGAAARRVREGGLDGVEIHAAHSYLLGQFLSPGLNHRDDGYGGSLQNRLRIVREVLDAVRAAVGADFPVGVRLVGDELMAGGLTPDDCVAIAESLEPSVDFLDVSLGGYWSFPSMLGTAEFPLGYELPTSAPLTAAVQVPTIVSGRIMTLDHANDIVASGQADLVSMVRALIADPDLVVKARERREAEIRPCVGSNEGCEAGLLTGRFSCVVNVAAGREHRYSEPTIAPLSRSVVVVGGGVAGMEAARQEAVRGSAVTLYEQNRVLGGQLRIAASVPARADLATLTDWLQAELTRLGVEVRLNTPVDPELPELTRADHVIVATGSIPDTMTPLALMPASPVPGHRLPHVVTSWRALGFGGRRPEPTRAVVVDDTGSHEALTVAQGLLAGGAEVVVVSRADAPGAAIPAPIATIQHTIDELEHAGAELIGRHTVAHIDATDVTLRSRDGRRHRSIRADLVVLCSHPRPERGLAGELTAAGIHHTVIGDATGTTGVRWAMRTAFDASHSR